MTPVEMRVPEMKVSAFPVEVGTVEVGTVEISGIVAATGAGDERSRCGRTVFTRRRRRGYPATNCAT